MYKMEQQRFSNAIIGITVIFIVRGQLLSDNNVDTIFEDNRME